MSLPDQTDLPPDHTRLLALLGRLARARDDRIDESLSETLAELGRCAGADRARIYIMRDPDSVEASREWVAPGIAPTTSQPAAFPATVPEPWRAALARGEPVHLSDMTALPGDRPDLSAVLHGQGITAWLLVPFMGEDGLAGFIGFETVRPAGRFNPATMTLLASAADLVAGTLARRRAQARLREAEADARDVLAALPTLVLRIDGQGIITQKVAPGSDGMAFGAVLRAGAPLAETLPEPLRAPCRQGLREVRDGRPTTERRIVVPGPDGPRWIALRFAPSARPGREPAILCLLSDVTAEESTRRRVVGLGNVAEVMSNHVIVTDTAGRVRWANRAFLDRSGIALDALTGQRLGSVADAGTSDPASLAALDGRIGDTGPFRGEVVFIDRRGGSFRVDLHVSRGTAPADGSAVLIHVGTDLTRLRLAEREADEARGILQSTMDALPDGFAYFDADDRLVMCNARYRAMYPRSAEVMQPGVRFSDLIRHGVARGEYRDAEGQEDAWIAERLAQHASPSEPLEQHLANGTWLRVLERPTPDGGRVGMRIDITALKRAEEALRTSNARLEAEAVRRDAAERRFRDIAAVSGDWFFELDADLRHGFLSASVERLTGRSADALIGHPLRAVGGAGTDWTALEARLAAREAVDGFIFPRDTETGTTWLRLSATPFHDARTGAFAGYRGVGSDVTALYAERQTAIEASAAKGRLLATMSHEVRTPLNAILGMAELLDPMLRTRRARELLTAIREAGEILVDVLNTFLDVSKMEAGQLRLVDAPFDPRAVVEKTLAPYRAQAQARGVGFDFTAGPGASRTRLGDAPRIQQILQNLLSNALKFTHDGAISVHLAAEPGQPLVLEVSDTGIGMDGDTLRGVFDPYRQAESAIAGRFGGTGLGLSIVRDLTALMGGRVETESRPATGTRFRIVLPLPAAPATEPPVPAQAARVPQDALAGRRILVADDSVANRTVLTGMLSDSGARVSEAADGEEALALWDEAERAGTGFDLVALDVAMPRRDGISALAALRERRAARGVAPVPALAVTASVLVDHVVDHVAAGFDGVLAKPFSRDDLHRAIAVLLGLAPGGQPPPRPDGGMPASVLIADDNAQARDIMAGFLGHAGGFEVTAAADGRAAFHSALSRRFDLLVLDRGMPGLGGDRVIRALRAGQTPNRHAPMILATGAVERAHDGRPGAGEADLYLPKPLDMAGFTRAARQLAGLP